MRSATRLLWLGVVLGCGLEELVVGELGRGAQVELPKAAPTLVEGRVAAGLAGASLTLTTGALEPLEGLSTTASGTDFVITAPGNTAFTNLLVLAQTPSRSVLGILPELPKRRSVLDPASVFTLELVQPGQTELGVDSTTATLLLLSKAAAAGQTLQSVPPSTVRRAFQEIVALFGADARVDTLRAMVQRLVDEDSLPTPPFLLGGAPLNPAALAGAAVDYTGDGAADPGPEAFEVALTAALGAFEFNACYPDDRIRVVLMADLRPGGLDRNCSTVDPFRWAKDAPGSRVFVTGGLHETTPRCGEAAAPCLDGATIDAANALLGNWVPNVIALHDDGTQGDAVAGDSVWTVVLELPWFAPQGPQGVAVRIGYKYTYGAPSDGWTGTEEWPGNKRVLELRDQNNDRLIVRLDRFGDETTNKDKANLLSPAKGGCGTVIFPSEGARPNCANDVFEAQVDTNGDCAPDAWPPAGTASPLVLECPGG